MDKPSVLLQLDCDDHVSSFDAIVAIDAGVDRLLQYAGVEPLDVRGLVHGAMFTRGQRDLRRTAIFLGGSDVERVEENLRQVQQSFFGPVRVSVMADPNGCNTTAVAAVLSAASQVELRGLRCTVLGGTGPVGQRIATLLVRRGASVRVVSRYLERAEAVAAVLRQTDPHAVVQAAEATSPGQTLECVADQQVVFAAGAAGVRFLEAGWEHQCPDMRVAIDCNAVPPAGLEGVQATDAGRAFGSGLAWGAIGVGGLKMKIHRRCIGRLFEQNDLCLDLAEILAVGESLL